MADFASIFGMANRPTSPAPDPIQSMGQVASIQHLGQQNVLGQQQIQQGDMQNQQMQQQLQDATELRETLKQAISSGQNPVQAVQKLASPAAQGWVKQYTEMAMNQTKLSKEQFDLASSHLAKVGGDVIAASQAPGATPQQVAQVIANHVQQGNIPPDKAQALLQTIPQDPAALPTWGMTQGATLGASKELLGLFTPQVHMVDQGTSTQPVAVSPALGTVKNLGSPIEKDIPAGDLKKFASDIGAIKDDGSVDMNNSLVKAHIQKMNTSSAVVNLNAATPGGGPVAPVLLQPDPNRPWRQNPIFQKAGALAGDVDQYLAGDLKPLGARDAPRFHAIQAIAQQIDPYASTHDYDLKQKALADPQVNATNAALGHIGDFRSLLAQLPPQTQAKVLNSSLQQLATNFKDDANARIISELHTTALSLSEEYGKALGAGQNVAGDQKREAVFDPAKPINQLTGNLGAVGHLLDRTLAAKENMLNRNNPQRIPMNLLDPSAADVLQGLGINHTPGNRGGSWQQQPAQPGAPAAPGASPATPAPALQKLAPADAAKLAPGTHFLGLDGVERVKH